MAQEYDAELSSSPMNSVAAIDITHTHTRFAVK